METAEKMLQWKQKRGCYYGDSREDVSGDSTEDKFVSMETELCCQLFFMVEIDCEGMSIKFYCS